MPTAAALPIEEYRATSYRPDCEYVDGRLVERNVGEWEHSKLQARLIVYLSQLRTAETLHVVPEQRVQMTASRFRVPDVVVVAGAEPQGPILTGPPFLCIEIPSRDDRMTEMQERIDDYLAFGVRKVWVQDPRAKRASVQTRAGMMRVAGEALETEEPALRVPLSALFG